MKKGYVYPHINMNVSMAAFEGDVTAVAAHLETGDINVKDVDGRTLLHWVGLEGHVCFGFYDFFFTFGPSCRRAQEANVTLLPFC
jgi:hypothetical protein